MSSLCSIGCGATMCSAGFDIFAFFSLDSGVCVRHPLLCTFALHVCNTCWGGGDWEVMNPPFAIYLVAGSFGLWRNVSMLVSVMCILILAAMMPDRTGPSMLCRGRLLAGSWREWLPSGGLSLV